MHKHAATNRFYRLVWSHVHLCWVAVAEGARGRKKGGARKLAAAMLVSAPALAFGAAPPPDTALPTGAQVVAGQATVGVNGNAMTVTQGSAQAILNWQGFDIGAKASVRFDQPSASAVALNRVIGTDPSRIYGKLSSNGQVFLINPQGVLFGAGAQVNVGGLVASTLNLADQDFLAGRYEFSGAGAAGVKNEGSLRSANGGYVALLGAQVDNSGQIVTPGGAAALAAGQRIALDLRGDGLINVRVTEAALDAQVRNGGLIQAAGGQVLLSAGAADALARSSVNNEGLIEARGFATDGGSIRLVGASVNAGALDVSSDSAGGGAVAIDGKAVALNGAIAADGARGGAITVTADSVLSAAGASSATGKAGNGGAISYRSAGTLVENADASTNASGSVDGGTVALHGGEGVLSSGSHAARGAAGVGGRIDISGAEVRLFSATLDASGAAQGGLVRVGGAFQGGAERADAPDLARFATRWGQRAPIASAAQTFINDTSSIDVSAKGAAGQGGTAVVWSNQQTTMLGKIDARGAAAAGAVEISSKDELRHVGLDAIALGAGGQLLLDPKNIIIGASPESWTYQAILGKGFTGGKNVNVNTTTGEGFGAAVALNDAGDRMAVGSPFASSFDTTGSYRGVVRLFSFSDTKFSGASLVGTLGSGYTGTNNLNLALADGEQFGSSLAFNSDATLLAVGAIGDTTNGSVRLLNMSNALAGATVRQTLVAPTANAQGFGSAVALNSAGTRLAVGALYDTGNFGFCNSCGAVYIYGGANVNALPAIAIGSAYASNMNLADSSQFGTSVSFNSAGNVLAVGAVGVDNGKGAVYLFNNATATPALVSTLGNGYTGGKNLNVTLRDGELFGSAVSFNDAGTRLAVGAPSNGGFGAASNGPGSVRIIDFSDAALSAPAVNANLGVGYTGAPNANVTLGASDNFGYAVALTGDGRSIAIGAPFANASDNSAPDSGQVHGYILAAPGATDLAFATSPTATTTVDAPTLTTALAAGTSITLQASNDITLSAGNPINVTSAPGNGSLTLQAGRSVTFNSDLRVGTGNLTIVANESSANGVDSANRDTGNAIISIGNGLFVSGAAVKMTIANGSDKTNFNSGDLIVGATVTGTSVQLVNLGPTAGSDIIISNGASVNGTGSGTSVLLAAVGGGFLGSTLINSAGNSGINAGAGRYLVYSNNPALTTEGKTGYNKHYNQAYVAGSTPAYAASGNWFLYGYAPILNVTADAKTKVYDGTASVPALSYSVSGLIDGDAAGTALSGGLTATGVNKNVATYAISDSTLVDQLGYTRNYTGANFTITKAPLTLGATGGNKVYDRTTTATASFTDDRVAGDTLNINYIANFVDRLAGNGKTINLAGLALSGTDSGNYSLASTTATTTGNITPFSLVAGASASDKVYDGNNIASVVLSDNHIAGDTVTLSNTAATFSDRNAANGKTVTVTGIAMAGADAGNYTLSSPTATTTANITKKPLTAAASASDKVYDGFSTATATLSANSIGGDDLTLSGSANFNSKTAAVGKTVTVSAITLGGADAGNYSLASTTAATTATITKRTLNAVPVGVNRTYNRTTAATVTFTNDKVAGDNLTLSGSASFADSAAGTAKPVSVTGIALSGGDAGNYLLASSTGSTTADIAKYNIIAIANANSKVYDGTRSATPTLTHTALAGDNVVLNFTGALYDDKNVSPASTITVSGITVGGTDGGNYLLLNTSANVATAVTPRPLTVGASAVNKVYDGNLNAPVFLSDNRILGDQLNITSASATFADKNVGVGKAVSVSGIAKSGVDTNNYSLAATTASSSANIVARPLTATATGVNKTYDGTTAASVTFGDNRVAGDVLTVSGTAVFLDPNAGTGKTVNVGSIGIAGGGAGNYSLTATTAATTADITARSLTVTANAGNKIYDGNTAATIGTSDNRIAGDLLTVGYTSATFNDKMVGNAKPVTVNGLSLSGGAAGNYTLSSPTAATIANITPRSLTASVSGVDKVYDGGLAATVNYADNRIAGDTLTLSGSATFDTRNVGVGKTVTATGITVGGSDAVNYTLGNASAGTTAAITARSLVASATANNKVYDGNTTATAVLGDNRIAGDAVVLTAGGASFDDKNAGIGKTVTITGVSLSGGDAGNYTLASTSATGSANITPRTLTRTASATGKVYDGGTSATVSYNDDRVAGDTLSFTQSASFADKGVGVGKTVTVSGMAVGGTDAGNYTLASTSTTASADITQRTLNVSASGIDKVYDGNTSASATLGDDRVAGDTLTVASATTTYGDKTVGAGKTVTVTGLNATGADAGNYALASPTATTSAAITARTLNATLTANDKVYDGNTSATGTLGDNRVAGDVLTVSSTAMAFGDRNAGTGKTVNASGVAISGGDAGNYSLASSTVSDLADISQRTLTRVLTTNNKVYDGSTAATVSFTDNRVAGDTLGFTQNASFADANAGNGKLVTVSGTVMSGADAGNYTLASTGATGNADITQRALTVSLNAANKVYDGNTTASATLADNRVAGDVLTVTGGAASFANKNVAVGKTVTVGSLVLGGGAAANYTLAATTASGSADITARTLTAGATATSKVYDGSTAATVAYTDNRLAGDVLTLAGSASFSDKNVGAAKTVNATGLALSGADAGNYVLASNSLATNADISARTLVVSVNGGSKVYDGTVAAGSALADNRVAGDLLSLAGSAASFTDKNVGANKAITVSSVALSGVDAGNYVLAATSASGTGSITPRPLNVTATVATKVYDATTAASVTVAGDQLAGDVLSIASGSAAFADKNVGKAKPVTVGGLSLQGADAGNYLLAGTATASGEITPRSLTAVVTGVDKTYDGTTAAQFSFTDNHLAGDTLTIDNSGASFADKDVGTAKVVTLSGLALRGADGGNYTLSNVNPTTTASITPKALAASITGTTSKVYDGNQVAAIAKGAVSLSGFVAGEGASVNAVAGTFNNANVGLASSVSTTVGAASVTAASGTALSNYTLPASASGAASITPRSVSVSGMSAAPKTYDGSTAATVSNIGTLQNLVAGEALTLSAPTSASFDTRSAGSGKLVTASGYKLADGSGGRAANYVLASTTATSQSGVINKATVVVKADDKVRSIGAPDPALTYSASGFVGGDSSSLLNGIKLVAGADAQSPAGTYAISASGGSLNDYQLQYVNGSLTVNGGNRDVDAQIGAIVRSMQQRAGANTKATANPWQADWVAPLPELVAAGPDTTGANEAGSSTAILSGGTSITIRQGGVRSAE